MTSCDCRYCECNCARCARVRVYGTYAFTFVFALVCGQTAAAVLQRMGVW